MLSNHLSDGIGMTRVPWSQLPNAEEPEGLSTVDDELMVAARNLAGLIAPVESLDYEVIENYAYREQQVLGHSFTQFTIEFNWLWTKYTLHSFIGFVQLDVRPYLFSGEMELLSDLPGENLCGLTYFRIF